MNFLSVFFEKLVNRILLHLKNPHTCTLKNASFGSEENISKIEKSQILRFSTIAVSRQLQFFLYEDETRKQNASSLDLSFCCCPVRRFNSSIAHRKPRV